MRPISCVIFALVLLGVLHLPADGQDKKKEDPKGPPLAQSCCSPPGHSYRFLDGKPLVFVVNGVGGSTTLSDNLLDLNGEYHLGLRLQMVPWCRHNARYQDLYDNQAQLAAATKIACTVTAIRKDCPGVPIYFVGHSAGARIVLAAAEMLPPASVDRVIVLAPAVSCSYDLTGALRASRGGIDHFYSSEDSVLDAAVEKGPLADGLKGPAAGRVGFRPPSANPREIAEFCFRVRQIRWTEDFAGSGGHNTWIIQHNLKKTVVPIFFQGNVILEPPLATPPPAAELRKMPMAK